MRDSVIWCLGLLWLYHLVEVCVLSIEQARRNRVRHRPRGLRRDGSDLVHKRSAGD